MKRIMHERFEELAEEAGMTFEIGGFPNISKFDIEKFAQLIVRECAGICLTNDEEYGEDEDDSLAYWSAHDILERFGLLPPDIPADTDAS